MREVKYICDICGKTFTYCLASGQKDREIIKEVMGKDFCYSCLKDLKKVVDNYKNATTN